MQRILQEFDIDALKQVVEQSPVSIIITNREGDIEYVNPAFSEITGYSGEELVGQNPRILKSGAHDKKFYEQLWDTISKGKTWKGEFLNKRKDGSLYWESATLSPVLDSENNIKYYVGTKEDISEKKYASEELLRTEMQFRNLAETAPVIIARIDKEGKLLYYNNYYLFKAGKKTQNVYDLLITPKGGNLKERIDSVFTNSIPESFEIEFETVPNQFDTFIVKISPNIIDGFVDSAIIVAQDITELLDARNIAQKSEENLLFLADNVADVIWMLDAQKKMYFVTPSTENVTGYSVEEFLNLEFSEYLPNESLNIFNNNLDKLSTILDPKYVEIWESELRKKNGDLIWTETRTRVLLTAEGKYNGIIGTTRDITERKKSEEAIYKSEVKFRSFFENSNAIILVVDPESERVIDINKAAEDYYGYSTEEFQKLEIKQEMIGLVEAVKVEASEVLHDFKNVYAQRHKLKNGDFRDVEILPAKVQIEDETIVYAIIQDVTQRKKAVEALRESESKKLALLKIIPDLIFVLNREGAFIDIYTDNPDRLIIPPFKLLGKTFHHVFPRGLCEQLEEKIEIAFKTREIQTFEYRYKRDLEHYFVEEIRVIVSGENEVLAIIRDITSQKQNEIELKRAWEEAKEASQVKDAFLANISHEIRTPINAILGFGELLQSELTNTDHLQYIKSIRTSSKSLLNLINDLLDLSKIEAGKMTVRYEAVSIRSLMNEIESIFSIKLVEKGLDFEINIHDNCPISVQTDEMRVRQILINLVSNAIKFTHDGFVKVNINAFNSHVVDYVEHIDLKIEVEDTGIGISEDNLAQIFEAFKQQEQQDAKQYGGTGLGLTITKRLAELLNGTIEVKSKIDKGSRFTVILYNLEVTQSARMKMAPTDTVFKIGHILFEPSKVLIADDVKTNRDFLRGVFKGSDIAFIEAADGDQAIELIKKHKPRMTLLDIKMPKKDGLEVAKYVKTSEELKHISTIGISATPVSYETDPRSIYLDEFVAKPINIPELLMKISYYLPIKDETVRDNDNSLTSEKPEEIELSPEIKEIILNELNPLFNEISRTSSFEDYKKFAKLLIERGSEIKINKLTYIGEEIIDAVKTFDLEKINLLFLEFKKMVADFSMK